MGLLRVWYAALAMLPAYGAYRGEMYGLLLEGFIAGLIVSVLAYAITRAIRVVFDD